MQAGTALGIVRFGHAFAFFLAGFSACVRPAEPGERADPDDMAGGEESFRPESGLHHGSLVGEHAEAGIGVAFRRGHKATHFRSAFAFRGQ